MSGTEPSVLRLLVFSPSVDDGYVDAALRSLAQSLAELPLCSITVGRRHDQARERAIATTWLDRASMVAALGQDSQHGLATVERLPVIEEARIQVLPLAFALSFDRTEGPSVLRVYRGRARPGELREYTEEVREGTFADASAAHGPITLCLAIDEPDRFVTVSTWTDWDTIMVATGGNLRHPIATRHSHRLLEGTADLYEILPTTDEARPAPSRSPAPG
jgi:hypothetical protein